MPHIHTHANNTDKQTDRQTDVNKTDRQTEDLQVTMVAIVVTS